MVSDSGLRIVTRGTELENDSRALFSERFGCWSILTVISWVREPGYERERVLRYPDTGSVFTWCLWDLENVLFLKFVHIKERGTINKN